MPDSISIMERRDGEDRRNSALSPLANGKGEWARMFVVIIVASVVGYFAATQRIEARLSTLESKVDARDAEIVRFMQRIDATLISIQQQQHRDAVRRD